MKLKHYIAIMIGIIMVIFVIFFISTRRKIDSTVESISIEDTSVTSEAEIKEDMIHILDRLSEDKDIPVYTGEEFLKLLTEREEGDVVIVYDPCAAAFYYVESDVEIPETESTEPVIVETSMEETAMEETTSEEATTVETTTVEATTIATTTAETTTAAPYQPEALTIKDVPNSFLELISDTDKFRSSFYDFLYANGYSDVTTVSMQYDYTIHESVIIFGVEVEEQTVTGIYNQTENTFRYYFN